MSRFILLMVLTLHAVAGEPSKTLVDQINWPEFLARHDPIWHKMPTSLNQGIVLGNGQIGAAMTSTGNEPQWTIYRQDITDNRPFTANSSTSPLFDTCRLQIGSFRFRTVGKVTDFQSRLNLWDALNTGTMTTDRGKIHWRAFVHAEKPLVLLEISTEGDEQDFRLEWTPLSNTSARWENLKNKPNANKSIPADYAPNPPVTREDTGGINISVHPLNAGGYFAVAWKEQRPSKNQRIVIATIMPVSDHAKEDAIKTLNTEDTSIPHLLESHRKIWHERYPASFVSIPDTRAEGYYWINIYKLYCATRADQPPIDVHGMWMGNSVWPNIWWNMNLQLAYACQTTANRLELAESLCSSLEKNAANLSYNIPMADWRADSAWVSRVSDQQLRSGSSAGWPLHHEIGNLSWAMEAYWRQCRYAGDDQRLRENFLPLLEKCLNTYKHILQEKPDGKLHLPSTFSPEYGNAEDCNYDLGALRWDLKTLIGESDRLGINAEKISEWKALQEKITDYPQGPEGLWIGANKPLARSHRHFSHLLAFYPLGVLDWDKPEDRPLIQRSVDYWYGLFTDPKLKKEEFFGYSYTGAASMYAWMENGQRAQEALQGYLDNRATPNAFYTEGTLEVGFAVCQSIHDLLLQSRNGIIRVFPALPETWRDVVFHDLRTDGAFLVSAARKDGKTAWVRVKSLAGEPCRIRVDGKEQILKLAKGEEVVLGAAPHTIAPVSTSPELCNYYGVK